MRSREAADLVEIAVLWCGVVKQGLVGQGGEQAAEGVELVLGLVYRHLAVAVGGHGKGLDLSDQLAQLAVLAGLGTGLVLHGGDAAHEVALPVVVGVRAVDVGHVVVRVERVADTGQARVVVVIVDGRLLVAQLGGDLLDQVAGLVVDHLRGTGVGVVDQGAPAQQVVFIVYSGGVIAAGAIVEPCELYIYNNMLCVCAYIAARSTVNKLL